MEDHVKLTFDLDEGYVVAGLALLGAFLLATQIADCVERETIAIREYESPAASDTTEVVLDE